MSKNAKHIIAILILVIPFYVAAILQKILLSREEILAEEFLAYYMLLNALGVSVVLLTNKFLLKHTFKAFVPSESRFVYDVVLAFLLLGAFYFIQSLSRISYGVWIAQEVDRAAMVELLNSIFSNFIHGIIIIGPFTWFNEAFAVLSLAFILNNLWALYPSKKWAWISIIGAALLFSLLQIDNGWSAVIDSLVLVSFSNYIYYHYRSIWPLFIAATLFQTIDLASFWIYVI